jgi:hypothetical protein
MAQHHSAIQEVVPCACEQWSPQHQGRTSFLRPYGAGEIGVWNHRFVLRAKGGLIPGFKTLSHGNGSE